MTVVVEQDPKGTQVMEDQAVWQVRTTLEGSPSFTGAVIW